MSRYKQYYHIFIGRFITNTYSETSSFLCLAFLGVRSGHVPFVPTAPTLWHREQRTGLKANSLTHTISTLIHSWSCHLSRHKNGNANRFSAQSGRLCFFGQERKKGAKTVLLIEPAASPHYERSQKKPQTRVLIQRARRLKYSL